MWFSQFLNSIEFLHCAGPMQTIVLYFRNYTGILVLHALSFSANIGGH